MDNAELELLVKAYEALPESTMAEVQAKAEKRIELINFLAALRREKPKCPA